jgi:Fic family protein
MTWHKHLPYNELPLLPPPTSEWETLPVLRSLAKAAGLVGELKAACNTVANPQLLLQSIFMREAQFSSGIENIVTTQDEIYQAMEATASLRPMTKEVLYYHQAMETGLNYLHKQQDLMTTNLFVEVMRTLRGGVQHNVRSQPGTALKRMPAGETIYTPPDGEDNLRSLLHNLEQYLNEDTDDTHPLVKMAIAHYQFEAIHPFTDGNGRTGRILNSLYLSKTGLLPQPVLFLSKHFLDYRTDYYRLLLSVTTERNWEAWLLFVLNGVSITTKQTLQLMHDISELQVAYEQRVQTLGIKAAHKLTLTLFEHPYCSFERVKETCGVSYMTARTYLETLHTHGLLDKLKIGKKVYFRNESLMKLLRT